MARFANWVRGPAGVAWLVVAAFTVVGGYARLANLGSSSLYNDEAQTTLIAFTVLQHGYPVIVSRHLINNWEPLYPYLEALSIRILGYSNFAYRLPAALLGIALIPLAYVIGNRLRDRYVGIAFAAMVALSTEYIAWSRTARWYTLIVFCMAVGFLFALLWYQSQSARTRRLCVVGMLGSAVLAALSGLGVFLLYVPGILVAGLVYLAVRHWGAVRQFFGYPATPGSAAPASPGRIVPRRFRLGLLILLILAVLLSVALDPVAYHHAYVALLRPVLGFTPDPLVWSSNLGGYLLLYYSGVVVFAALGAVYILLRRDAFDIGLVALAVASFASVSVAASITSPVANGGQSFVRHLLPLLYFLFLLASVALVETGRRLYRWAQKGPTTTVRSRSIGRALAPVLFGVAIAVVLVVPCIVVPSGQTLYPRPTFSPADSLVPWVAFSPDPRYPSAIYYADQADYQLASLYVKSHANATQVVAATNCGPPEVYLGHVQYWVRGNPILTTIIYRDGQPEFQQTGSILLENSSALESVMFNTSGWLISDALNSSTQTFPGGMTYILQDFMTTVPAGSDASITLYFWNHSTPLEMLRDLQAHTPSLQGFGSNTTQLADWATSSGVTFSPFRGALLPIEGALLAYTGSGFYPLALLIDVYNHRPDLQAEFPQVLQDPSNDTALIEWAYSVASGATADPAHSVLAPYESWYEEHA